MARERNSSNPVFKLVSLLDGDLGPTVDSKQSDGLNALQEILGIDRRRRMANCEQKEKRVSLRTTKSDVVRDKILYHKNGSKEPDNPPEEAPRKPSRRI